MMNLITLLAIPWLVNSMPYLVLRNKAAKCFKMEDIKPDTLLLVHYHTPDVVLESEVTQEGSDYRYSDRQKQRIEMMKSSRMKDINILIQQRQDDYLRNLPDNRLDNVPRPPTNKLRVQLEDREGVLEFSTASDGNSIVEICLQSYFATQEDPSRVGLNLTIVVPDDSFYEVKEAQMSEAQIALIEQSNRVIKSETSGITQELLRLEKDVVNVKRDIGRSSRQANDFQKKTEKLNNAVYYWPMFRIFVLLLAGYLQVSHVLNYMKKHHIR